LFLSFAVLTTALALFLTPLLIARSTTLPITPAPNPPAASKIISPLFAYCFQQRESLFKNKKNSRKI
jgi:hypothetical protein